MQKTLLITGGLGYIGSHGVVSFTQAGYKCIIVDNLSNSDISTLKNIEKILGEKVDFFEIDLRDKEALKGVFEKYGFDGVIHFAGAKAVGESVEKPFLYYENNITGSLNLFELMEEFGVKNILFSSSATVYDEENYLGNIPVSEDGKTGNTTNPYGTTKFLLERILKDLSTTKDFSVVNLRYFNPIGAHISGLLGENPKGIPNNLLPYIFKVALGELKELGVFGDNYETIDGTGVRDYIDVGDLIDGHLEAYKYLEKNIEKGCFEVFNLGGGKGASVLEMIQSVERVIDKKIPYIIKSRREGDIAFSVCNPKKAHKILEWKVKIDLEESLKRAWKFYNKI